jgi:hypothetical protein
MDQGAQRTTYIHNFYKPHQVLKLKSHYFGFEILFSALSCVKEKIKFKTQLTTGKYVYLMYILPFIGNCGTLVDQEKRGKRELTGRPHASSKVNRATPLQLSGTCKNLLPQT